MGTCKNLQKSLDWCMGTPELPGIQRKLYYISKSMVVQWPQLPRDENGRVTGTELTGNFTLQADAKFHHIIILPEKSQLTSDAQGEAPSQTQLNKLVAVHPSVGKEATDASAYMNNEDNVFVVQDMKGKWRVVGSPKWTTKTTITQDNGQGATGTTATTINVEATDEVASPFYTGTLTTEEGEIDCSE